jgi:membrane protease YdiL (CAAX protease family)
MERTDSTIEDIFPNWRARNDRQVSERVDAYFRPDASAPWMLFGLQLDRHVVGAIVVSTLLLTIEYYHRFLSLKAYDRLLLFLFVPVLWVALVWRQSPGWYGLQWGDWRAGARYTLAAILVMGVILFFVAQNPAFVGYYGGRIRALPQLLLENAADLFGWEFLFRGFLLFALARRFGPEAIFLQAVPFAIAHLSKPELETITTIFGGAAFGYLAWRTRSMLYPFLIHWFMQSWVIFIAGGGLGR